MQVNYVGLQPTINLLGHRSNFPVPWLALVGPGVDTPLVPKSLIPCCILIEVHTLFVLQVESKLLH